MEYKGKGGGGRGGYKDTDLDNIWDLTQKSPPVTFVIPTEKIMIKIKF